MKVGAVKLEKPMDPASSAEAIDNSCRRCSSGFPEKSLAGREDRENLAGSGEGGPA
jgi:hypothetical protein